LTTFTELGVAEPIVSALSAAGITVAFPIQEQCIPQALEGRDLIGQAKTGTGKTLGFGVPLLQRTATPGRPGYAELPSAQQRAPKALVVVPTRELCVQVTKDIEQAGAGLGARVLAVYGGRSYEPQIESLTRGVDVVVGTPGRLIDLARQRHLVLAHVRVLVLDEADEMLDMGFLPDVEQIVSRLPQIRQTMLFSATMPGQIISLARRYMNQPTHIRATDPGDESATVDAIEQHVWRVHPLNKVEILARIMQAEGHGPSMIFCRTKRRAQAVADELADRGFAAGAVHGDLGQGAREQALRAFRNGKVDILVATDVAARGIDVEGVTHVINYECPDDEKTYLHRIGRTGRAGASGVAITFVDWEDVPRWQLINKALGLAFHEPIETYHTSEHLYTGLGIPRATGGTLPRAARTRAGLDAEVLEDLGGRQPAGREGGRGRSGAGRSRGHSHHHGHTMPHGPKEGGRSGAQGGRTGAHGEHSGRQRQAAGGDPGGQDGPGQAGPRDERADTGAQAPGAEAERPRRRRRQRRRTRSGRAVAPPTDGGGNQPPSGEPDGREQPGAGGAEQGEQSGSSGSGSSGQ
jgi:superfamily II DNA/RNA helicase